MIVSIIGGFNNIFSRRATGFHSWPKVFELNFILSASQLALCTLNEIPKLSYIQIIEKLVDDDDDDDEDDIDVYTSRSESNWPNVNQQQEIQNAKGVLHCAV